MTSHSTEEDRVRRLAQWKKHWTLKIKQIKKCDSPGEGFTVILCHIRIKEKDGLFKMQTCKLRLHYFTNKLLEILRPNWKFQQCGFVLCAVP